MENNEKETNLFKSKGVQLSDDELDAVSGGLLYTVYDASNNKRITCKAGLKRLSKWLKNHRGREYLVVINGWSEEAYWDLHDEEKYPGVIRRSAYFRS